MPPTVYRHCAAVPRGHVLSKDHEHCVRFSRPYQHDRKLGTAWIRILSFEYMQSTRLERKCSGYQVETASSHPEDGAQTNDFMVPPQGDDIDRALEQLQKYIRDPSRAVIDLMSFIVSAVYLMRHVYTPGIRKSVSLASCVLLVVMLFISLVWGLDTLLRRVPSMLGMT